jgi:PDZ domain
MMRRIMAVLLAGAVTFGGTAWGPAWADNPMGYRLLSEQEASALPQRHGTLGLSVARAQQIRDHGLVFDILRVQQVRPGSPGAQAGLKAGDQIIAMDGRVFPSLAVFAAYVGSMAPGSQAALDYMPAGGGPAQAQRVGITIGGPAGAGRAAPKAGGGGLSTGAKLAIGAGAAALLCYKMGCFSRHGADQ